MVSMVSSDTFYKCMWCMMHMLMEFSSLFFASRVAAYQVGLSFLTTHMRRAVAACTSPEVFFGAPKSADVAPQAREQTDALGLAMEALSMS